MRLLVKMGCVLSVLSSCCPVSVKGLPATGQTEVYDDEWKLCSRHEGLSRGQDGHYQRGYRMGGRFNDMGDGTVLDECTGLMWQEVTADTNGDGMTDLADVVDWKTALQFCEAMELGGYHDWRLPNVIELQSIVDYGRCEPAINSAFKALSTWYWSSTTFAWPDSALAVHFWGGVTDPRYKRDGMAVRAVRGGG